jgi:hypothetical protein
MMHTIAYVPTIPFFSLTYFYGAKLFSSNFSFLPLIPHSQLPLYAFIYSPLSHIKR